MSPNRTRKPRVSKKTSKLQTMLKGTGAFVAENPSIVGGCSIFFVVFGFVALNALFYQKSEHPAPILNMRNPETIISGSTKRDIKTRLAVQSENLSKQVTTLKIKRQDQLQTAAIPVPSSKPVSSPLVSEIQGELARLNLYKGTVDGLTGPKTVAAIKAYQQIKGLDQNGIANEKLLRTLYTSAQTSTAKKTSPKPSIQGKIPTSDLVTNIQIGLKSSAYPDITVDGVAGQETREAISRFENHYRLAVTGQPSQDVLQKLIEIGAFN